MLYLSNFSIKPLTIALAKSSPYSLFSACIIVALSPTVYAENSSKTMPSATFDTIIVTASPLQAQAGEMATATSIIRSSQLEQQTATTLGDVLTNEVGVSADTFGQGASRPIIRGQTAPRVKVMQNGLTVQDASQISPDHQVSVPVVGAEQIEVIKGTSALLYGGGAVGGVVNVVDNTIKNRIIGERINGKLTVVGQQATDGYLGYAELNGDIGDNWVWSASLQKTDQGNLQVPHWDSKEVNNSWYTQDNARFGLAYVTDTGHIGASFQQQASEYGLPFHVHNQCSPDANNPNQLTCPSHAHHHTHGKPPFVDLRSNVYQLYAEKQLPMIGVEKINGKISYTDYQHDEIDEGVAGTTFTNKAINSRLDATHLTFRTGKLGFMKGIVGVEWNHNDFSAVGLEGYLPKTKNQQVGIFFVERITPTYDGAEINNQDKFAIASSNNSFDHDGHNHGETATNVTNDTKALPADKSPWYIEFGGRQEFQTIKNTQDNLSRSQTGSSFSLEGGKYLTNNSQISVRASHSQRLPTAQELYANGAHLATNAWERGNSQLNKEVTNGIELTYRYNNQKFETSTSIFYNDIKDYIYAKTQDIIKSGESAGFRLIDYNQTDAKHYGGEITTRYRINKNLSIGGFADIALIELQDKTLQRKYAPRLTAPRVGGDITASFGAFDVTLSGYHRFEQDKIADFETVTPSYNMLNAKLVYNSTSNLDYTAFIQVSNILNELAYNHASYLVEHVPLLERSINVGLSYRF